MSNAKLFRLLMVAFGIALVLPVAMTTASRIASAAGSYMWASDRSCDPAPDNPDCVPSAE